MTIHKAKTEKSDMTIAGNMTIEARDFWAGLVAGTIHPPPCQCDLCLYSIYRKRPGRPFSRSTFFINWLVHRMKMTNLIDAGRAQRIQTHEGPRWKVKLREYDKAPYIKTTKAILDHLYDESGDESFLNLHDTFLVYRARSEKMNFIKLMDDLTYKRYGEWLKTRPDLGKKWKANRDAARLCQRIVDFIQSRPGQKATQRELERHFSNKRKADLEAAFRWFPFFPVVKRRKRGKSAIFSWTRLTPAEIEAYNQRVAREIRQACDENNPHTQI